MAYLPVGEEGAHVARDVRRLALGLRGALAQSATFEGGARDAQSPGAIFGGGARGAIFGGGARGAIFEGGARGAIFGGGARYVYVCMRM
eukprot:2775249-Prymnesium_polylepis.1